MASSVLLSLVLVSVTGYPTRKDERRPDANLIHAHQRSKVHYIPVATHHSTDPRSAQDIKPIINSSAVPAHSSNTEPIAEEQHFFPSFSAVFPSHLGHFRPQPYHESHDPQSSTTFKSQDSFGYGTGSFKEYSFPYTAAESERSLNLLGSGNFGVLRGGTYYPRGNDDLINEDLYNPYYRGNNDHNHQLIYPPNPLPKFKFGVDFFANFKDFADINSPAKTSYSEYHIVYNNPNVTKKYNYHIEALSKGSTPKFGKALRSDSISQPDITDSKH